MNLRKIILADKLPNKPICNQSLDVELTGFTKESEEKTFTLYTPEKDDPADTNMIAAIPEDTGNNDGNESKDSLRLTLKAEAAYRLLVLNNTSDTTSDKLTDAEKSIIANWPGYSAIFGKKKALMVQDLTGKVKASLPEIDLGNFSLGFDASQLINLKSFRVHDCSTTIAEAFARDISGITTIFQKNRVLSFQPNEAVSMGSIGKLEFNGKVSFSDMFTGAASIVSGVLGLNGPLNLQADASLSLTVKFAITDDFNISIIRLADDSQEYGTDQFQVRVNRKKVKESGFGLAAKIEAGIKEDDDFDNLISHFFKGIDPKVFDPIVEKRDQFEKEDLPELNKAAKLLGQKEDFTLVSEFEIFYKKKKEEVAKAIKKVAITKIALGIGYEYKRIKTTEVVYQAVMSKAFLDNHYSDVRKFRIGRLLDAKEQKGEYKIENFLRRITTEIQRSFGISLALGEFKLGSKRQRNTKDIQEIKLIKGKQKVRIASYSNELIQSNFSGKNEDSYHVNLGAEMDEFVNNLNGCTASKFDYELGLQVESKERKTSEKELKLLIDWAVVWDIIPQSDFQKTLDKINNEVIGTTNRGIKYSLSLGIAEGYEPENKKDVTDDEDSLADHPNSNENNFDEFISYLGEATPAQMASALAAATPYAEYEAKPVPARATMAARRLFYPSFFLDYFGDTDRRMGFAYSQLIKSKMVKLFKNDDLTRTFETTIEQSKTQFASEQMSLLLTSTQLSRNVKLISSAFEKLDDFIDRDKIYDKAFKRSFGKLSKSSSSNPLYQRYIGRILLDVAEANGIKDKITRSLKITYKDGENEKVLVIG